MISFILQILGRYRKDLDLVCPILAKLVPIVPYFVFQIS